jgi:hypothetical protein
MSEREMADPQTYRGGAQEPEGAKGGAPGGVVPREMVDEPTSPPSDEQELKDESLGGWAQEESEHQVPRDGGDNADATRDGGPDPTSQSRVGGGSSGNVPGRVGDAHTTEGEDAATGGTKGVV